MIDLQPDPVDAVGQLGLSRMGRGRKQMLPQFQIPQRCQRIDHQDIGIQIQHFFQLRRKQLSCHKTIIHLPGIAVRDRSILEQLIRYGMRIKAKAIARAALSDAGQAHCAQRTMQQMQFMIPKRIVQIHRSEHHAQLRHISFV